MMSLMIHLYNLQTRRIGINQIKNVYMSSLVQDVNQLYLPNGILNNEINY